MEYSALRFYGSKLKFHLLPQCIRIAARHDYKISRELLERMKPYIADIHGKKVIDVGCGNRFPFTLLFHSLGVDVVGIDIDVLKQGIRLAKYRKILATQGLKQVLIKLAGDFYRDKVYYRELRRVAEIPLRFKGLDLREMDAGHTAFGEEEFDLVVSNAAFEHMQNVAEVLVEMKRIMRKNAIMHIEFSLFSSLTGGHNYVWGNPDTQEVVLGRVPPWDHLRKQLYPIDPSLTLNTLRESEYKRLFSENFEVLEWITEYTDPESYLTPELRAELSDYSVEELLKSGIVVIARKV